MPSIIRPGPALVFDFGGVLIDWDPRRLYRKFFADDDRAVDQFLAKIGFAEWNLEQDRGRSFGEAVAALCQRFPESAVLIRAYDERWEESIRGPIQPTVGLLKSIKRAGYPLYGLTNWSVEKFQIVRRKYEFFSWFDDILVSGEARLVKPDPRLFVLLLDKIGRTAGECIYIDDSAVNVKVARQLGFDAIQFESEEGLRQALAYRGVNAE